MTRFVRIQLIIFTVASIVGMTLIIFTYMQAPTLLGVGRLTVKLELANAGGLYRFANVTLRGVQIGKVTAVEVTRRGAQATLSLDSSPKVPADLQAEVRSVSAVGEQYVDLIPRADAPPYLHDGSVIHAKDTVLPQPVGPLLDQVSALIGSIPKDKISALLDESYKGFNGSGFDFGSLVDSSSTIAGDLNGVADRTRTLIKDGGPLLDSQAATTDAIRLYAHSLAGVTGQIATDDSQVRSLLQTGPGFADEVSRLLNQLKPTLPILLANLTTIEQIAVTYNASLRQALVLQGPLAAQEQASDATHNPVGYPLADISLGFDDPPACTVGFLPLSQWRSPADTTEMDTPDGLYCKLPQDSPISVRGVRNFPCMEHPGKRAPTVQICDSDKPYQPLAMRQHALGPGPLDPNLLSQGIPPDDRVGFSRDRIFGPVQGTPLPSGTAGPAAAPGPPAAPAPPGMAGGAGSSPAPVSSPPGVPELAPPDMPDGPSPPPGGRGGPSAAPSSFNANGSRSRPSVAVATYDPSTGRYVAGDNQLFAQTDMVSPGTRRTWKDLILPQS
jgi:phospholipid/cholesterol/gamma-HCH transport system substrate-binding protein